ncbi:hypothetical protein RUND412_004155 [Rhizina undulata]
MTSPKDVLPKMRNNALLNPHVTASNRQTEHASKPTPLPPRPSVPKRSTSSIPYIFPIEHVRVYIFPLGANLTSVNGNNGDDKLVNEDGGRKLERFYVPSGIMVGDLIQQLGGCEKDWLEQISFEEEDGERKRYWVGRRLGWSASESLRQGFVGAREWEDVLWLRWWRDPGEAS